MSGESLSKMDGTRENPVPSVVSLSPREASAILPLPNEEGTETLPKPSPSLDQEEMSRARKYHQLIDTHGG